MGQFLDEIPGYLIDWILKQHMFWVASAPLSPDGHVNISPKAIEGTFHVVNSRRVWYEDLSGSGAETVAHIRENGRVTILFHAFEGPPRIVRLYGRGFFYELGTPEYEALITSDRRLPGSRAVIGLDVYKVGTTCGYAVPYYQFLSHRTQLMEWAAQKEAIDHENAIALPATETSIIGSAPIIHPQGMRQWWQSHNIFSLDGLPSFSINFGRGLKFGLLFALVSKPYGHLGSLNASYMKRTERSNTTSPTLPPKVAIMKSHQVYSVALTLFPFFLTLIIGFLLGRVYDHYRIFLTFIMRSG